MPEFSDKDILYDIWNTQKQLVTVCADAAAAGTDRACGRLLMRLAAQQQEMAFDVYDAIKKRGLQPYGVNGGLGLEKALEYVKTDKSQM